MQKISIEVLEKAIKEKLTSAELDLLLYVARFQDEAGRASEFTIKMFVKYWYILSGIL